MQLLFFGSYEQNNSLRTICHSYNSESSIWTLLCCPQLYFEEWWFTGAEIEALKDRRMSEWSETSGSGSIFGLSVTELSQIKTSRDETLMKLCSWNSVTWLSKDMVASTV